MNQQAQVMWQFSSLSCLCLYIFSTTATPPPPPVVLRDASGRLIEKK